MMHYLIGELYTYRFADTDVLTGVGQKAGCRIAAEDLNLVAVTAAAKQELSVGCDIEHTRMSTCRLIADARE